MKIQRVMSQQISAADAYAMVSSKAFQEQKCVDAGALSWHVDVTVDGDSAVVRTRRKLPTVGFPSLVRKLVPNGVTSTETITWGAAQSDGSRSAFLYVDFHGAPARMSGTIRLIAISASESEVQVDADFTAPIPIVGRKVEQLAAQIIISVVDAEEQTGQTWAAANF